MKKFNFFCRFMNDSSNLLKSLEKCNAEFKAVDPTLKKADKMVWMVMDSELHSIPGTKVRLIRVNAIKSISEWVMIVPNKKGGYEMKKIDPKKSGFTNFNAKIGTVGDSLVHVNAKKFKKQLYIVKHSMAKIQTFKMETICVTKGTEITTTTQAPATTTTANLGSLLGGILG